MNLGTWWITPLIRGAYTLGKLKQQAREPQPSANPNEWDEYVARQQARQQALPDPWE